MSYHMMMQSTEIPFSPPPPPISLRHHPTLLTMNRAAASSATMRPWPGSFPTQSKSLPFASFGNANCMEQLLVHCAEAIDNNDATPAQQILWVLNNIARPDGDSTQRLTCAFLRALISRAALTGTCKMVIPHFNPINSPHKFSLLELAHFVDLTPWHRFGFTAANSIILEAISDLPVVHIVDLSISHCMQIPTLIDSIATRLDAPGRVPPIVKLTVGAISDEIPPVSDLLSYDELGMRLINFARFRNIVLEFKAIPTSPSDGFASLLEEIRQSKLYSNDAAAVIVNCQMSLHLLQEEEVSSSSSSSMRGMFLQAVRSLEPSMVVVVEEDVDFTARSLVGRLRSAFNHMWIPFDTVDTFLPRGSQQREWFEAEVCWKIENVIAHEGPARVERQEPRARWALRMREAEFQGIEFGDEGTTEVKAMLEEHAAGWVSKKEEDDLVLTWKGHNVVFASAWVAGKLSWRENELSSSRRGGETNSEGTGGCRAARVVRILGCGGAPILMLGKSEFDELCMVIVGHENIGLHNYLIKSIVQHLRREAWHGDLSVEEGEEVDQVAISPGIHSRGSVTPPLGIPWNGKGNRKVRSDLSSYAAHAETCYGSCELPDTSSLRKRLEHKLENERLRISLDCVGLDVFRKRLIMPSLKLASSRIENKQQNQIPISASMLRTS
ncbi:hypothetical protein Cgig2_010889 [Carnegiea gigantea]|uniref:Scarecrow-like protein 32 n=1 Tax=Carnegiea gigantea TaxID=171969 RepID=A0A9Q1GTT8_9CARY|nr:hypothetical protein Cgig2_010889 [Carnegiea gigantea]